MRLINLFQLMRSFLGKHLTQAYLRIMVLILALGLITDPGVVKLFTIGWIIGHIYLYFIVSKMWLNGRNVAVTFMLLMVAMIQLSRYLGDPRLDPGLKIIIMCLGWLVASLALTLKQRIRDYLKSNS